MRIAEGIPPAGEIEKPHPGFIQLGDISGEELSLSPLQGLAVVADPPQGPRERLGCCEVYSADSKYKKREQLSQVTTSP